MRLTHCAVLLLVAVLLGCQAILSDEFNHFGPDGTDSTPTDTHSDTNTHTFGDTHSDTITDTVGDSGSDTVTSSDPDSGTVSDSGSAPDTDTNSDTRSDADTTSDTQTDTTSDVDTTSDTHTSTSAETDTTSAADTDSDTHTETAPGPDTDTDTDTDTQCVGQPDFTPCDLVTPSDRQYDICIHGVCRSPGCGSWECNPPGPNFVIPDSNQRDCYDEDDPIICPVEGAAFYGQDGQYGWDLSNSSDTRFTRLIPDSTSQPVTTDTVTGLIWQGCSAGQIGDECLLATATENDTDADEPAARMNWDDAVVYCDALQWGGWQDWRLPSYYELLSIIDSDSHSPAIDGAAFPVTIESKYWTISNDFTYPGMAWNVDFFYGRTNQSDKDTRFFVRCVRGGTATVVTRYTRTLPAGFADNPVVTDNAAGLMWQGCLNNFTGATCEGELHTIKWVDALDHCEKSEWAGHTNWRLPSRNELLSVLSDRTAESIADLDAFPFEDDSTYSVWSATTQNQTHSYGWLLRFGGMSGGEFDDPDKSNAYGVAHCLRDVSPGN